MAGVITNAMITSDTDFFIECIEKRPALYKKSLKEYSDVNYKRKLWNEVCYEVVPGWEGLDAVNKNKISTEVLKKWVNLRTCFAREVKAQNDKSKIGTKRRKYIYYKKLLFLMPTMSAAPCTKHHISDSEEEIDSTDRKDNMLRRIKQESQGNSEIITQKDQTESHQVKSPTTMPNHDHQQPPAASPPRVENHRTQSSQQQNNSNIHDFLRNLHEGLDEETYFALSLVPVIRSLSEDEKFEAKIEILHVLRRIKMKEKLTILCSPHDVLNNTR